MLPMIDKLLGVTARAKTIGQPPSIDCACRFAMVRDRTIMLLALYLGRPISVSAIAFTIVAVGVGMQGTSGSAHAQDFDASAIHPAIRSTCPSDTIAVFFQAFAESPELQRVYTASTLETAFVDWSAQPEPIELVELMPRETLHFPLVPNRAAQQQRGLRYREVAGNGNRVTVVLERPDTDMQLRYTFRRDTCWILIKIVDPAFGKAFPGEAPPAPDATSGRRN